MRKIDMENCEISKMWPLTILKVWNCKPQGANLITENLEADNLLTSFSQSMYLVKILANKIKSVEHQCTSTTP